MKTVYLPSNGQAKELLVRGTEIVLALPVPPVDLADPVDWARSVLPDQLRPLVVAAEEAEVRVVPAKGGGTGLAGVLGSLAPDGYRGWTVAHVVVLVTLRPASGVRHATAGIPQWPGAVEVDGVRIPRPAGNDSAAPAK